MNTLKNTYVYTDMSHEDIDILKQSSVDNINDGLADTLYLMKLNKLPMADKLVKLVSSGKIRFINNDKLTHATVKWVYDKGYVLINAAPYVKRKRGVEDMYSIALNELYSLILSGTVFLYSNTFNKNRDYIKSCTEAYCNLMGKAFTKACTGHFRDTNEVNKFYFLMTIYLLNHNDTIVRDVISYASANSGLDESVANMLQKKYNLKLFDNLETFCNDVLKEEFRWADKLQPGALIHAISTLYGASNTYMLENIDTVGAIMADCVMGGKPNVFSRYANLKGIFKSTSYNNIISILRDI